MAEKHSAQARDWVVPASAPGAEAFGADLRRRMQAELAGLPPSYLPRTHHLSDEGAPRYSNRLILEASPYLLQHAHNPVNWYPWGEQAFADAKRLGRPVFLSIGYSTCHWCHVMERESFEDPQLARFINEHFIAIKVDREERPDIDSIYMHAIQTLGQSGGWPMTVILTPEREPFFGGTYFPPRALKQILTEVASVYRDDPRRIATIVADVRKRLASVTSVSDAGELAGAEIIEKAVQAFESAFDSSFGGFSGAPKFPASSTISLLLRYYRRSGDQAALHAATFTLERMAGGGIYDQVGGGFHRYSTDSQWLVPHFEKMLYDNAQLAVSYLDAYQVTHDRELARVARETLDYVLREMTSDEGGFYSATDADSADPSGHLHEGWFFTWTVAELEELLDHEQLKLIREHYGVGEQANFEGRHILHIARPLAEVADQLGLDVDEARRQLNSAHGRLYDARKQRTPPGTDTKVLVAWNGLMISALARGARVLGSTEYAAAAERAAAFLWSKLRRPDDQLYRSWARGRAANDGVLDDYAFFIAGLLDLFEATGDSVYLEHAISLQRVLSERFADKQHGGFFFTAAGAEELLVREKPKYDGAEPTGNAVAIGALLRLAELTGEDHYRKEAERSIRAFADILIGYAAPTYAARMLIALDFYTDRTKEIVIVTPNAAASADAFLERLKSTFQPNSVLIRTVEGQHTQQLAQHVALVRDKKALQGKTTAYVCENRSCDLPTSDPELFAEQIGRVYGYAQALPSDE